MTTKTGIVQDVQFTRGGAGNQWTTIDGVRYATWWDSATRDWKIGDTVAFRHYKAPLWSGNPPIDCAEHIYKTDETK